MKVTAYLFIKLNLVKAGQPTRRIFAVGKACITSLLFATSVFTVFLQTAAKAQITPATNDAGTVVNPNGNTLNIEGGTKAGANLLHSFEKFGVNQGQTANFISNPSIQNILGRVTGGDASVINGLIQVTGGNSNLYLMNPAGIIFGSGASLNVPAAFTATTANGIGLGDKWFSAAGTNDYATLVGNPSAFAFTQSGAIFNAGNLAVASGQNLTLLGGTVVNTGTISAPSGNITIAAVPEEKLVRVTQAGSLLSLRLPVETKAAINPQPFTPLSLPQLLTGGNLSGATGVTVENGVVKLTGSGVTIPNTSGTAVVSNKIDVSGATGGTVNVLGDKVGLVSANINASGTNGGGTVLVGGDYQGKGTVPNASQTFISRDSTINADALQNGNGGRVIAWADGTNRFYGNISARGGASSGDGGFVEVSGKQNLTFDGLVDLGTTAGKNGLLLLDPFAVRITTDAPPGGDQISGDNRFFFSPGQAEIRENSLSSYTFYITPSRIVELLQGADVSIAAQNSVQVEKEINASSNSRSSNLTLTAPQLDIFAPIILNGGNLNLTASTRINLRQPFGSANFISSGGGNIAFNGPVVLNSFYNAPPFGRLTTNIDSTKTGERAGNITFNNTINSFSSFSSQNLSLNASTFSATTSSATAGDVKIIGAIGNSQPLGVLDIRARNIGLGSLSVSRFDTQATEDITLQTPGASLNFFLLNAGRDINVEGQNLTIEGFNTLSAGRDLKLQAQNLTIQQGSGSSPSISATRDLTIKTQGTLTLDKITLESTNGNLNASSGDRLTSLESTFKSGGNIRLESQNDSRIEDSQLRSPGNLTLESLSGNLTLPGTELSSIGNIQLRTPKQVQLSETTGTSGNPSITQAKGTISIEGTQGIDIQALNRPESVLRSGGDFSLVSNNAITGNARISSGGNFFAEPGTFSQSALSLNGIISSNGNVSFEDYTGSSLKVEARGSIRGGNINITQGGAFPQASDPDTAILNAGPAVILRAGATKLQYSPDSSASSSVGGTSFAFPEGQLPQIATLPGSIEVGNISTETTPDFIPIPSGNSYFPTFSVILSAAGEIKAGNIITKDGSVKLTTTTGNIVVNTINTRGPFFVQGGGNVEIDAGGIFRAQGTFPARFTFISGSSSPSPNTSSLDLNSVPTSILTSGLVGGTIDIKHRGESFVERYTPGSIADNVSGTVGLIIQSSGSNAGLYGSFSDRTLAGSSAIGVTQVPRSSGGISNGSGSNGSGSNGSGSGNNNTLSRTEQQTAQRQVISQSNGYACNASTTVATAPQPTDSRTGDASNQTVSSPPGAASNNCTPANNDQQILQILDETPNSGQNKELFFDSSYPRFSEFAQQATFKN